MDGAFVVALPKRFGFCCCDCGLTCANGLEPASDLCENPENILFDCVLLSDNFPNAVLRLLVNADEFPSGNSNTFGFCAVVDGVVTLDVLLPNRFCCGVD